MIPDWVWGAALSGLVTGLITYGGIRVELRWHRTDIDRAHKRLDVIESAIFRPRRMQEPPNAGGEDSGSA